MVGPLLRAQLDHREISSKASAQDRLGPKIVVRSYGTPRFRWGECFEKIPS
ncbi:MAG: hypothetical protein GY820_47855 [Gammaproteobacteria bacterium]|nr:hypothetical protein [Gammaproteobacteria bacterium]